MLARTTILQPLIWGGEAHAPVDRKLRTINLGHRLRSCVLGSVVPKNLSGRLLEIGCGDGALAEALSSHFNEVVAIDRQRITNLAPRSSKRNPVKYVTADFETHAFANNAMFDVVVSAFAVHHFDFERALVKMRSLLRPGGELVVIDIFAERKSGLIIYLLDQLCLSFFTLRSFPSEYRTRISLKQVAQYLFDRVKFVFQKGGIKHIREDLSGNRPPSFSEWKGIFDQHLAGGEISAVCGSTVLFRWQAPTK